MRVGDPRLRRANAPQRHMRQTPANRATESKDFFEIFRRAA